MSNHNSFRNNNGKRNDSNKYSSSHSHPYSYSSRHRRNNDEQLGDDKREKALRNRKRFTPQQSQRDRSSFSLSSSPLPSGSLQPTTQLNQKVFINLPMNPFNLPNQIKSDLIVKNRRIVSSNDARENYNTYITYYDHLKAMDPNIINNAVFENMKQYCKYILCDHIATIDKCKQLEQENLNLKNQNQSS